MFDESSWSKIRKSLTKKLEGQGISKFLFLELKFLRTESPANAPLQIYLGVPSSYHQARVEADILGDLLHEVGLILETPFDIQFEMTGIQESLDAKTIYPEAKSSPLQKLPIKTKQERVEQQKDKLTLSNFIITPKNQLCLDVLKYSASFPQKEHFPILIQSPSGTGKTHLLKAFGREIFLADTSKKCRYITGEGFITDFMYHIRGKQMPQFHNKYRKECDVLLIDEISVLRTAKATQEELVSIIDTMVERGKCVLASTSIPLCEIPGLLPSLKSRLSGGFQFQLDPLGPEEKLRLINSYCTDNNLNLSLAARKLLVTNSPGDIRVLKGMLIKMGFICKMHKMEITDALAAEVLNLELNNVQPTPEEILQDVSRKHNVKPKEIISPSRKKHVSLARKESMKRMKQELDLPFSEIGRIHGNRDHSTVLRAICN